MDDTFESPATAPLIGKFVVSLLASFGIVLGLLFAAPFVTTAGLDRDIVAWFLERATGQRVTVRGEASFSFVPAMTLQARGVTAQSTAGDDVPPFLDVDSIEFQVETLPLLFSRVVVQSLRMESPTLRFVKDRKGQGNWRDRAADPSRPTHAADTLDPDWGRWKDLLIADARLSGGRLLFVDRTSGHRISLQDINLRLDTDTAGSDEGNLRFHGSMKHNGEPVEIGIETGAPSNLVAGAKMNVFVDISSAAYRVRYMGGVAKRHHLVSDGRLDFDIADISRLQAMFGGLLARPVSGPVHGAAGVLIKGRRIAFTDFGFSIGNAKATGDLSLWMGDVVNRIEGSLRTDLLDLTAVSPAFFASPWWKGLNGSVGIEWQRARYDGLMFGKGAMIADFGAQAGLNIELRRLNLYGGHARGLVRLAHYEGMLSLGVKGRIGDVDGEGLLRALAPSVPVAGDTEARFDLFTVGGNAKELTAALRGSFNLVVNNGRLVNPKLATEVGSSDTDIIPFTQLIASFDIRGGIAGGREMLLRGDDFSLLGAGQIDLATRAADIRLQSIAGASSGEGRKVRPLRLAGSLAALEIRRSDE